MKNSDKTGEHLLKEIEHLKTKIAELEKSETKRKQTEETLKQSEKNYRILFDNMSEGIFILDAETQKVVLSNKAIAQIYGFDSEADALEVNPIDFVLPEDKEAVYKIIAEDMFQNDLQLTNEFRSLTKDGREIWISAVGVRTEYKGRLAGLISVRDITERKLVEDNLRKSEDRFRQVTESIGEWIWEVDTKGVYTYVSNFSNSLLGYHPDEILGKKHFCDFFTPDIKEKLKNAAFKAFANKESFNRFENPNLHKDGHTVILETSGIPIHDDNGNLLGYRGADKDITERKQAEKSLQESEKRFRSFFENSIMGIYRTTAQGDILSVNPALLKMLGYSCLEELKTRNLEKEGYEPGYERSIFKKNLEKNGKVVGLESAWTRKDGSTVFVRESSITMKDDENNVLYYEGTVEDITERKKAERELEKSENKYRDIITSAPIGYYQSSKQGEFIIANDTLAIMLGYENANELIKNRKISEIYFYEEERERLIKLYDEFGEGKVKNVEVLYKRKDGSPQWIYLTSKAYKDDEGETIYYEGFVLNISQQKEITRKLRDSEIRYHNLFENSSEFLFTLDLKGNFTDVNKAAEDLTGYTKAELLKMNFKDYTKKEDHKRLFRAFNKIYKTGEPLHNFYLATKMKDKSKRHFEISLGLLRKGEQVIGFQGSSMDITERKQAEQIQKTLYNISNAINTVDNLPELYEKIRVFLGNVLDTTNFFVALYDEKTDMISLSFHVDEKDEFETFPSGKTLVNYIIQTGKPLFATNDVVEELTQKGVVETIGAHSEIWLGVPLKIENKIIGVITVQSYDNPNLYTKKDIEILTFVSEEIALAINRKQVEEKLKSSEERLKILLESAPDAIYLSDLKGIFIDGNKATQDLLGYKKEELIGKSFFKLKLLSAKQLLKASELLVKNVQGKGTGPDEFILNRQGGSQVPVEIRTYPIKIKDKTVVMGIARDISERKKAENKLKKAHEELLELHKDLEIKVEKAVKELREKDHILIQQSRHAAMGEMIGNIAHQWRQPLAMVAAIIQNYEDAFDDGTLDMDYIEKNTDLIMDILTDMSRTIDDFRYFFKTNKEKENFNIKDVILKTLEFLESSLKFNQIEVSLDLQEECIFEGFPNEYSQVLLVILSNAKDELIERNIKDKKIDVELKKIDDKYVVKIFDNAGGITKEVLPKVFDPYFTTKEQGKGTGVGLYMAKMIIDKNMDGKLTARNLKDGAEFRIEV